MKRTKNKAIVTLAASAVLAASMVSTAFAAPTLPKTSGLLPEGVKKNCPKTQQLTDLAKRFDISLPASLPPEGTNPANCPRAKALQQLLDQYGLNLPAAGEAAPSATKAPAAPAVAPVPTAKPVPAATSAPAVPAAPANGGTVTGSMSADEQKMVNLVNQDRAANGLPALTFDSTLRAGAVVHSRDMMQNNFFSHTSPTHGDFTTRIRAAGVKYTSAGENIARYGSVEAAEAGFMNSPGHRANILNTNFTRIGIGIVYNQGTYYITQWFAK